MPPPPQPEDFSHLPSADGGAADARRAKEALWKQVRQNQRQTRIGGGTVAPPADVPPVAAPAPEPEREPAEFPAAGWGDLLALNPEDGYVEIEPLTPAPRTPMVATPVETETRGDMPSRKRTVVRRSPLPPTEIVDEPGFRGEDPQIVTRVVAPGAPAAELLSVPAEAPGQTEPECLAPPLQEEPPKLAKGKEKRSDKKDKAATAGKKEASTDPKEKGAVAKEPPGDVGAGSADPSAEESRAGSKEEAKEKTPAVPPNVLWAFICARWIKWGGQSLGLSLGIHALVLVVAGLVVVNRAMDTQVDFIPGGGSVQGQEAAQDLQHKIQQKKNPWLRKPVPMRKVATNAISEINLPEEMPDILDLPKASPLMSGGGALGGGMGLGGGGGGFGKGVGLGGKDGMVFQPLSMFGREIKAKRLALIMDVSASMAPHLPRVVEEVDKVAKGSVIVLFYGCGVRPPPPGGLDGEEVYRTSGIEFEKYWRMNGSTVAEARNFKFKPSDPIPMEEIFRLLSRRPQTFFVHNIGTDYTWTAILSEQVRQADALYWFADFQDYVDFKQLNVVYENLTRRKQKLYIHPYQRGSSYDLIRTQLVERTNGDVIDKDIQ